MAPDPGLLRAARERGKSQTQPRWVSRVRGAVGGGSQTQLRWVSRVQGAGRWARAGPAGGPQLESVAFPAFATPAPPPCAAWMESSVLLEPSRGAEPSNNPRGSCETQMAQD